MPIDLSFVKAPVEVPKLSGFDKSHFNELTSKCGTITPVLVDELMCGSKVNLKIAASACLPPLASDTFMRVSLKLEAFFVPMRILIGSYESWFVQDPVPIQSGTNTFSTVQGVVPYLVVGPGSDASSLAFANQYFASPGTLADYLGFRRLSSLQFAATDSNINISIMPFLAYGKIWDDWYRAPLIQKSLFAKVNNGPSPSNVYAACFPDYFFTVGGSNVALPIASSRLIYADGSSIFALRQRNFGLDYFTTATPSPQLGSAQTVSFSTSGATGQFSIAALRAANSLQQFTERNNLSSPRYQDSLRARYGVNLSSGVAQRSLLLGSASFDVYSKGIYQSNNDVESTPGASGEPETNSVSTNNPFKTAGANFGSARASGQDFIIKGFQADEPGYLFVMATLVPKVTYGSGIRRYLLHYTTGTAADITQMANPILQNVGPQPIIAEELAGTYLAASVFGYTDRYAEYKTIEDGLHGLLRDGQSLQAFALQRNFVTNQAINSAFLQIPTNYMDQVTAVTADLSNYGYWLDAYFDYKVAMPLSRYSLPSLQDPAYEHGKTIIVNKGGTRL